MIFLVYKKKSNFFFLFFFFKGLNFSDLFSENIFLFFDEHFVKFLWKCDFFGV